MPEIIEPASDSGKRSMEIVISPEEIAEAEKRVIKRLSKRVRVPGFRPGNIPPAVLKARFGDLLKKETMDEVVGLRVRSELEKVGAKPLGQITITKMETQENGSLRLTVEYESLPELVIPDLSRITVEKRVLTISDVDVVEQLEAIQKSLATLEPVDRGIREGDHIVAEMTEFDPRGEVTFTGKVGIHYTRDELDPYLYDELAGKREGDECEIVVVAENEKGEQEERKQHYKVLSVKEERMPEMDDEFARARGYESLEAMKEDTKARLEERVDQELTNDFEWKIIHAIYDAAPFEVPSSLVKARYESIKDRVEISSPDGSPVPEEQKKAQIMKFAEDLVKRELILRAVARQFSIEVTDEDLEKELAEEAREAGVAPKKLKKKLSKDDLEHRRYVALLKKAMDFLKEAVHTEIVFQ